MLLRLDVKMYVLLGILFFFLSMIRLSCCNVLCISCWYLVEGSFWIKWKLLSVMDVCTFFRIFLGVYVYDCFLFVGLDNYRVLRYKFLVQLPYII